MYIFGHERIAERLGRDVRTVSRWIADAVLRARRAGPYRNSRLVARAADADRPRRMFSSSGEGARRSYEALAHRHAPELWLDVLLYTGLRRGDALRLGRQHVRDGVATIRTEKRGVEVSLMPILPVLHATPNSGEWRSRVQLRCQRAPADQGSFGNALREACKAAGVPGSAHGVRKIAATRAADDGATESELMALFGWTDAKMASHYTRTANRRRLAAQAMNKVATSIPAPSHPVRAKGRKY